MKKTVLLLLMLSMLTAGAGQFRAADTEFKTAYDKIPIFTGNIIPTPQEVKYYDDFVSLENVVIVGDKNFGPDNAAIKYLTRKIKLVGGRISADAGTRIYVGLKQVKVPGSGEVLNAPDKPEGYSVKVISENVVAVAGNDRLGTLWGIVSAVQMMTRQDNKPVMKKFDCVDWPAHNYRGMWLCTGTPEMALNFAVAFKMNHFLIYYSQNMLDYRKRPKWMDSKGHGNFWFDNPPTEEWLAAVSDFGEQATALGIKWQVGFRPLQNKNHYEKIDSRSDAQFNALLKYMEPVVKAGGGISIAYDDIRFPLSEADRKNFGSAREADIFFLNRLYKTLKKTYPDFELSFCPPFYWGPDYEPAEYGESRDEYLYALGERLPKDVDIYWSGKAVWAGQVKKAHVDWITKRIKRKVLMAMNTNGMHHFATYHYGTDPVSIWLKHYDGFYDDVKYSQLTMLPHFASYLGTEADFLWNPAKYNPVQAPLAVSAKLVGQENVALLDMMNKVLSELEQYEYKVSPGAVKKLPEIKSDVTKLNELWAEAMRTQNADMFKVYTGFGSWGELVNIYEKRLEAARNKLGDEFADKVDKIVKTAQSEAGFNPATDIIFTPVDLAGGLNPIVYRFKQNDKRLCTGIRSNKSFNKQMSVSFRMSTPPTHNYKLIICGQDDDSKNACKIAIEVNNNRIFAGANPFKAFEWKTHEFEIPAGALHEGENSFVIKSLEDDGAAKGPPFFLVNYVIIKNIKK